MTQRQLLLLLLIGGGSAEYFGGPRQALRWLYRQHGVRGLYRGYAVFLMRDVPASGIYIAVYELLYNYLYTARSVHSYIGTVLPMAA